MKRKSEKSGVGVIGGGSWGTTIAQLLARKRNRVILWVRDEALAREINEKRINSKYFPAHRLSSLIEATTSMAKVADESQVIFVVVPSRVFREVVRRLGDFLHGEHILISATKGIEDETFKRMSEIIKEETPVKKVGVLSGPNIAEEIMRGHPSATIVASRFELVKSKVISLLNHRLFNVYGSSDVTGVELAGTFKNIVAIASGIAHGKGFGVNTFSYLMTEGLREMKILGEAMGAEGDTFISLAGIGDLIATCTSQYSRNFRFGKALSEGLSPDEALKKVNQTVEGIYAAKVMYHYAEKHGVNLPLLTAIHDVIYRGLKVEDAIEKLTRVPQEE